MMNSDSFTVGRTFLGQLQQSHCQTYVHFDKAGDEEPCNECLGEPVNLYSNKPTKYVEKEKKNDRK